MKATPEINIGKVEALYGYAAYDHAFDGIKNLSHRIGLTGLKYTGLALVILGWGTFAVDTVVTSNAADVNGFRKASPERTRFVNDFRGWRSSYELGAVAAGVILAGVSQGLRLRQKALQS